MTASAARIARAAAARDVRDTVKAGTLEVDRAPVTNRRYSVFVAATGHRSPLYWPRGECPATSLDHPVVGIDFFDAIAFALWSGGALPTEEEWLAAAGLPEPAAYAWGDLFDSKRCNTAKSGIKGTTPVGAYPLGAAPSGCVDLCGNVWEMTCTAFSGDRDSIVVKGGSWSDLPAHARLDTQFRTRVNKGSATVGFRLVYGVPGLLPHFLDRELVDQCISFRKADAPHFDASGDAGEFDAIVESLRKSAGPHLARLQAEARAALVGSETGAPAPAAPPFLRRLRTALREIGNAAFWRKILPVLRVFLKPGRVRSPLDRFRAAWVEAHRPRRGVPLRQALSAAAVALFPDHGRALRERLRATAARILRRSPRPQVVRVEVEASPARQVVKVRGTPPALPSAAQRVLRNPRRLFVLACIFAGCVVGLLGTVMRDRSKAPARAPVEARLVTRLPEAPALLPAPPAPPSAPEPPAASPAGAPPAAPLATRALSPADVETVLRRLTGGRPQERDEAERFLIWHRAETATIVRDALKGAREPAMRAALEYVAVAIEEEEKPRADAPTVVTSPPEHGLVLVCESPDATDDIAMVRRTGRAERIEVTIVLAGAKDAGEAAKSDLGDVRLYADSDGSFVRKMRLERLPAVLCLRRDGTPLGIAYGRLQRSRLADLASRLR